MNDLINRQDAIDLVEYRMKHNPMKSVQFIQGLQDAYLRVLSDLKALPPADVVEHKRGKWIRITQGAMPEQYMCPLCHRIVEAYGVEELLPIRYPYCHCGADMRGEEE